MEESAKICAWNLEWAKPTSKRGVTISKHIAHENADIWCVTEGFRGNLLPHGYSICTQADYGYPLHTGRRKGWLWSKYPWRHVEDVGSESIPSGRFVSGTTSTPFGELKVICVCIPWRDAHVHTGQRNRKLWEEHLAYLNGLREILSRQKEATIVIGDYNQRIPKLGQPAEVYNALQSAFVGFEIATQGTAPELEIQLIDHLAHTPDLQATWCECWPNVSQAGLYLSDHPGFSMALWRKS